MRIRRRPTFMKAQNRPGSTTNTFATTTRAQGDSGVGLPAPAQEYQPCRCGTQWCRSGWPPGAPPPAELPDPLGWLNSNGY